MWRQFDFAGRTIAENRPPMNLDQTTNDARVAVTCAYDNVGNLTGASGDVRPVEARRYDMANRCVWQRVGAASLVTEHVYDKAGRVVRQTA